MYHTRYTENKLNWSEFEHGRDELNPIFSLQIHGKFCTLNDYNDRASRILLNFKYIIRWMVGENRSFTAHYVCVCVWSKCSSCSSLPPLPPSSSNKNKRHMFAPFSSVTSSTDQLNHVSTEKEWADKSSGLFLDRSSYSVRV